MARTVLPLSNTQIKHAKPKGKEYSLPDGEGLMLRIKPNGSKIWIFNFTRPYSKKRANMSFGAYPSITLEAARKLKRNARELLAQNIDPQKHRKENEAKMCYEHSLTLEKISREWHETKNSNLSPSYANDIINSLENHVFPTLGNYPINDISAPIAIDCLQPLANSKKLEMVKRICQRLNNIMTYATNRGIIKHNPLTGIKEVFGTHIVKNNPALKPSDLSELVTAINKAKIQLLTRYLIEWQLHTMTRPGEAAGAKWDEIDTDKKLWTIPPERMKKRREHIIPLTTQTIELLSKIEQITHKKEFIFPSHTAKSGHLNESTVNMALKRMGFKDRQTAHGLRSLASTILNEQEFNPDIIETALAHVDRNNIRATYNRAKYIEQRRDMMQWWSDHITKAALTS